MCVWSFSGPLCHLCVNSFSFLPVASKLKVNERVDDVVFNNQQQQQHKQHPTSKYLSRIRLPVLPCQRRAELGMGWPVMRCVTSVSITTARQKNAHWLRVFGKLRGSIEELCKSQMRGWPNAFHYNLPVTTNKRRIQFSAIELFLYCNNYFNRHNWSVMTLLEWGSLV